MSTAAIDDPRVVNLSQEDIEMDEEYEHDEREWGDLLVGLEQEKEPSVRWGAQARNDDLMEQLTDDPELLDEDDREYREAQRRGLKRPAEKIAGSRRAKKKVKKVKKSSKNEKRKESKSKGSKDKEAPAKEAKKKKKKVKKDDSSTSAESSSSEDSDSASSTSSSSSSSSSSSDEPRKKRKKKASRKKDKLPARIAKAVGDVLMVTAPNDPSSRQVRDLTEIVSLLQEGRIRKGIQRLEGRIALIKAAQGSDERLAALEASAIAQKLAGASNPTSAAIAAVGSFVPRQARMRPRYPQQPRQQTPRAGEKCFGCGMEGHRVRECRQKAP